MLANILDYSATVFPVTTCDRDIDKMNESYTSFNEMDQRVWNTCKFPCAIRLRMPKLPNHVHSLYVQFTVLSLEADLRAPIPDDPDVYHGTPVAVQLTCRRFEEEKVVALTEMISQALSQHLDTS